MPRYNTDHQNALYEALRDMNEAIDAKWAKVVEVTNEMVQAIEDKTEHYDASFPPDLERMMDKGAENTAWIYGRLQAASKSRRNTRTKIIKALGYNQ